MSGLQLHRQLGEPMPGMRVACSAGTGQCSRSQAREGFGSSIHLQLSTLWPAGISRARKAKGGSFSRICAYADHNQGRRSKSCAVASGAARCGRRGYRDRRRRRRLSRFGVFAGLPGTMFLSNSTRFSSSLPRIQHPQEKIVDQRGESASQKADFRSSHTSFRVAAQFIIKDGWLRP